MKTHFYSVLLIIGMYAGVLNAQTVRVSKRYVVLDRKEQAYFPVLSKNGKHLLFSGSGYKGLKLHDLVNKSTTVISDETNAGYEPFFENGNNQIFYRKSSFESGRKLDAIYSYNPSTKVKKQVLTPKRNLVQVRNANGFLLTAEKKLIQSTAFKSKSVSNTPNIYVSSENLNIVLYRNGQRQTLNPLPGEQGSYLWVSLSPDATKILFTAARKGTFVCDLDGKVISSIGKLNAPVWYNNQFVVGMQDVDDGHVVTSSKILMKSIDGKISRQLSVNQDIAMYPSASSQGRKVAFNTLSGSIQIVELTIK